MYVRSFWKGLLCLAILGASVGVLAPLFWCAISFRYAYDSYLADIPI